jgi:hypothetical protein
VRAATFGGGGYNACRAMLHCFLAFFLHFWDKVFVCLHWPFCPGVFIAFLAVAAVIVTFRLTPETTKGEKAIWIIVSFLLMFGEICMLSKDREAHDKAEKMAERLRWEQSVSINFLLSQSQDAQNDLSYLRKKSDEAKGNYKLTAELRPKIAEAEARAEATSKELSLAMAPGIVDAMDYWAREWQEEDRKIDTPENSALENLPANATLEQRYAVRAPFDRRKAELAENYLRQLRPTLRAANTLREQLLKNVEQSKEDRENAIVFDKVMAGQTINWNDMGRIAGYMRRLVARFSISRHLALLRRYGKGYWPNLFA